MTERKPTLGKRHAARPPEGVGPYESFETLCDECYQPIRPSWRQKMGQQVAEVRWVHGKPLTEQDRLDEYHTLIARGLSDAEARGTAWPETRP